MKSDAADTEWRVLCPSYLSAYATEIVLQQGQYPLRDYGSLGGASSKLQLHPASDVSTLKLQDFDER